MKIKGLISENTIVLKYEGQEINVQRNQDENKFLQISQMLINRDEKGLIKQFLDIKKRLESYSEGTFTVDNNRIVLKGDSTPVPQMIAKKLLQLEKDQQDFMPLIRFWKKLRQNPCKNSREQLYGFMVANDIPLTEQGDIVVEKGVAQKRDAAPGELVDRYTKTVDNSIGMVVEMPREKVNPDPNQTCSHGLHVGAPKYVRKWYSNDIIVECTVNPKDVVSVPKDYNNTKMRVCKYQVMGYSDKSRNANKVVSLSDFIQSPTIEAKSIIDQHIQKSTSSTLKGDHTETVKSIKAQSVVVEQNRFAKQIESMTAKQIIQYVHEVTGVLIEGSLKNKSSIFNKAVKRLELHEAALGEPQEQFADQLMIETSGEIIKTRKQETELNIDLSKYDNTNRNELIKLIKDKFNEDVSKFAPTKSIISKAVQLFTSAGYQVKQ